MRSRIPTDSILAWPIMGALKQTTINAGSTSHPDANLTAVEAERWVPNGSPKPPMLMGGVRNEPEAAIVNKYDVEPYEGFLSSVPLRFQHLTSR